MSKAPRKYRKRNRSSSSDSSSTSRASSSKLSDESNSPHHKKSKLATPRDSTPNRSPSKGYDDHTRARGDSKDKRLKRETRDKKDRRERKRSRDRSPTRRSRERSRERRRSRDRSRERRRSIERPRRRRSRERSYERSRSRERSRDRRIRDRSRERKRSRSRRRDREQRSRSRTRRRSRDRSHDRKRDRRSRSRERRRSRERSSERPKETKDSKDNKSVETKNKVTSAINETNAPTTSDDKTDKTGADQLVEILTSSNTQEQMKKMEDIFKKRREQAEKWRREKKSKAESLESLKNIVLPSKKWTLEDDEDDEDDPPADAAKTENDNNEDEIDPLDAFMQDLHKENSKITTNFEDGKKVKIVTSVAKQEKKYKGELIEQNQDALEYSEEEEEDTDINPTQNGKSKKLVTISAEDLDLPPFKKNLYVEVPELAKMTPEDVKNYREELEGIKIKGKDCPKPIRIWAQCGLSKKILEMLKNLSYDKPTPIQAQAIPAIMSGRDVIGIAKTGSGKTLAFLLPMFRHILVQPSLEPGDGAIGIIVTPTRELAMQIAKECKKFAKPLKLSVACVYGGAGVGDQISELKRGAEIIVCTPGRMIEMLVGSNGKITNLRRCTYLVLDEADRMFDMGFEPQLMRIIDGIRPDRQTVLFSATFPRTMEALARRILFKPIEITVGGKSIVCKDIKQEVMIVEEDDKFLKLLQILGMYQDKGSALVFVEKQEKADYLLTDLMKASYNCMTLHGGIDQVDRESTISDFKAGKVNVLVATSVAARGLDVKHLILVVNYDCPNHYEDYVHRCGRTGRAGKTGFAYTFLTSEQGRNAGDLIKALELSESPVPDEVKNLWETYKSEQEAAGKKVKSNSGFSGKGFKFDEAEAQMMKEKKKLQKASLDINDSDNEDDDGANIDEEIENLFSSKKSVKKAPLANMPRASTSTAPSTSDKLKLAMERASNIVLKKEPEEAKEKAPAVQNDWARAQAQERARRLCIQLNYVPKESDEEEEEAPKVEEPKTYEEELEINDFPQNVRWKITYREKLAQIGEYADVNISIRGSYIPPGKEPSEDERKLYLLLEGRTEMALAKAKAEIVRVIKEELAKSAQALPSKSRYTVM